MDVVKKKIQSLQQQVDDAEDRALEIQRELDTERELHEKVRQNIIFTASLVLSRYFSHSLTCLTLSLGIL